MSNVLKNNNIVFGGTGYVFGVKDNLNWIGSDFITGLAGQSKGLCYDSINNRLLVGLTNNTIIVCNPTTGVIQNTFTGFNNPTSIAFDSVGGHYFILNSGSGIINVLKSVDYSNVGNINMSSVSPKDLSISKRNNVLLVAYSNSLLRTYALSTLVLSSELGSLIASNGTIAFDDILNRYIYPSAQYGFSYEVVNYSTNTFLQEVKYYGGTKNGIAFSPNYDAFAIVTDVGNILIYNNSNYSLMKIPNVGIGLSRVCWVKDSHIIVSCDSGNKIMQLKQV